MDHTPEKDEKVNTRPTYSGGTDYGAARLKAIFNGVSDGILLLDAAGRVVEANPAYLEMHDYRSIEEMYSRVGNVTDHFAISDAQGRELRNEDLPHHRGLRGERVDGEIYRLVNRKTGKTFYGRYSFIPIYDDEKSLRWVLITIHDITDIIQAGREQEALYSQLDEQRVKYQDMSLQMQREILRKTREARQLVQSVALLDQRERAQLSKILHEDLQQILLATKMRLDMIAEDVPEENVAREDFAETSKLLKKAVRISRALALELNPPTLESEGFDAAVKWLVDYVEERHDCPIRLDLATPLISVPREHGMIILHILRHVLTAMLRDFKPNMVSVTVRQEKRLLTIEAAATGGGIAVKDAEAWLEYSDWAVLREHLRVFGGLLAADAPAPGEIRARLRMPVPKEEQSKEERAEGD